MHVSIFKDKKISASFCRANSFLVQKHKKWLFNQDNKEDAIKTLWKTEFSADLDIKNKTILFKDEKSEIIYNIKFGQ